MEIINHTITSYDLGNGFCVDIERNADGVSSWLYKKGYGIKEYMFGFAFPFYDNNKPIYYTDADMIDMITPEYIEQFIEEFGF